MRGFRARFAAFNLFVAFAFTVMADPVSSVAYAIEAALRKLDGDLGAILPTMALVLGTIAVIAASYHQLVRRFPGGGGSAEALAAAFGEGWAFLPAGALLVDFTLTIAVSAAAAASAVIAYVPELAGERTLLAVGVTGAVAAGAGFGHRARIWFATSTLLFVACALVVIARGAFGEPAAPDAAPLAGGDVWLGAALLAMPLGMALATGVEAPSNAIAQLGQLDARGRRLFGQLTIWLMLAIVGFVTLALTALAVRLDVGLPDPDSTLVADVARTATGGDATFAAFQAASALLLLAAAASSYFAGSGLLKALALHGDGSAGLVPAAFGRVNRYYVPYWALGVLLVTSAGLTVLAGGRDQELVQFYAVAVFTSFLGAVLAGVRLSWRERARGALAINVAGTVLVAFVLTLNLRRLDPIASLAATGVVALYLWRAWVRRGRPTGVARTFAGHQ